MFIWNLEESRAKECLYITFEFERLSNTNTVLLKINTSLCKTVQYFQISIPGKCKNDNNEKR